MDLIHGSDPWVRSMDQIHGSDQWIWTMDPIHGSDPWIRSMDQIHESDQRIRSIDQIHGSGPWIRSMDLIHGTNLWIRSMDLIQGSDPKGSRGSPKKNCPTETQASPNGSQETPRHVATKTNKFAETFDENWSDKPQDSNISTTYFEKAWKL